MHDPWDKGLQRCTNWGGGALKGPTWGQKRVKVGQTLQIFSETKLPSAFKSFRYLDTSGPALSKLYKSKGSDEKQVMCFL